MEDVKVEKEIRIIPDYKLLKDLLQAGVISFVIPKGTIFKHNNSCLFVSDTGWIFNEQVVWYNPDLFEII